MAKKYHHLSYHLSPEGHFSFDFRKMREVSIIFEQRGYMPPMQTTETKTCRWNKKIILLLNNSSIANHAASSNFLSGKANIITQKIYSPMIKSSVLVCRFFGHSTFPVTLRCHLRHCGSHDHHAHKGRRQISNPTKSLFCFFTKNIETLFSKNAFLHNLR